MPSIRADLKDPRKREELKLEATYLLVAIIASLALAMNVHAMPKKIFGPEHPHVPLCDSVISICVA